MRFYLDEDHSDEIAAAARRRGVDITCSLETERNGWTDRRLLQQAGIEGRCVVTRNYSDFAQLTREFDKEGLPHAGVVFVPKSLPGDGFRAIAAAIVRFDEQHTDGVPPYSTWWLSSARRQAAEDP
jgi:hypothetical protein